MYIGLHKKDKLNKVGILLNLKLGQPKSIIRITCKTEISIKVNSKNLNPKLTV